jgi:hypothetical protein
MASVILERPAPPLALNPERLIALPHYEAKSPLGRDIMAYLRNPDPRRAADLVDRLSSVTVLSSQLFGKIIRKNGRIEDLGLLCEKVVTTAGVNYIAGYLTGTNSGGNFKFHGLGTGATAPAIGDTALVTELTTQYTPANTRTTGTSVLGASNNIYQTVGTNTIQSAAVAVTEFGVFTAAAAGTLLDRFTFSVVNLAIGDGLQTTFNLTFTAGG